jgi:hypothetical protein
VRWWKVLGLAGFAGVAASGVVIARAERQRRAYSPQEITERLHARLAEASGDEASGTEASGTEPSGTGPPAAEAGPPAAETRAVPSPGAEPGPDGGTRRLIRGRFRPAG